ncbi:Uu.00g044190.m01.CDS01 [Anthostomella pinea]|uniref:Uu.00g044190.m01.CDS01 n=1 Tax=Anthostomella pinea TaxID=933095 RepID=A0AAI8VBX9_9PEZI|nr:Uu.00g044190.m01.CDS01 [Anthostomella pinea]
MSSHSRQHSRRRSSSSQTHPPETGSSRAAAFNPLLLEPFYMWYQPGALSATFSRGYGIHSFKRMDLWAEARKSEAFMRRGASWRRMLVQQPAVTALPFLSRAMDFSEHEGHFRPVAFRGTVSFPDGLTMGALYDVTHQRCEIASQDSNYYFRIVRPELKPDGEEIPPDMVSLLDGFGIVYEEHGYYHPSRVLATNLEVEPWDMLYRHPEFENIEVRVEKFWFMDSGWRKDSISAHMIHSIEHT